MILFLLIPSEFTNNWYYAQHWIFIQFLTSKPSSTMTNYFNNYFQSSQSLNWPYFWSNPSSLLYSSKSCPTTRRHFPQIFDNSAWEFAYFCISLDSLSLILFLQFAYDLSALGYARGLHGLRGFFCRLANLFESLFGYFLSRFVFLDCRIRNLFCVSLDIFDGDVWLNFVFGLLELLVFLLIGLSYLYSCLLNCLMNYGFSVIKEFIFNDDFYFKIKKVLTKPYQKLSMKK
jgi:hypothetical protein